jgi:hypothetical protein
MQGQKRGGVYGTEFSEDRPKEEKPSPVEDRRVYQAVVCPTNASHPNARIYRRMGKFAYAVCNDCGETWKVMRKPD